MVIMFNSEQPRKQLLEKHLVATFRVKPHKTGRDWANAGRCKPKLADVAISLERKVKSGNDLKSYVHISGFATLDEWLKECHRLNPKLKQIKGFLYLVAVHYTSHGRTCQEDNEVDSTLMLTMGAFNRRITNTWINPAKSRGYYEDLRRVFVKDESPEGLYPACIVTENMLGQVVVIVPVLKFKELLEAWKKLHPEHVKKMTKLVQS